jgi:hypothetical protein
VERREVQRHVGSQPLDDPARHRLDLVFTVVQAGDDEVRDLDPHVRLVHEVFERVEHGRELAGADVVVEALGERLEVHVRGVHVPVEFGARRGADLAGSDRDGGDAVLAAGIRHVDGVFEEDHRVVVRERDAAAAELGRRAGDRLGRGAVGERVRLARLADVPVLTEPAGQVAARRPERQHRGPGQEVIERLLLDRIDAEAARTAVRREHDLVVVPLANEAHAALALAQLAEARAQIALHPPVFEEVPVPRGPHPGIDRGAHGRSNYRTRRNRLTCGAAATGCR